MKETISLHINGHDEQVVVDPATPLLYVLRNNLGLNGPKFGCGLEQCGACMALIEGKARTTCLLPVEEVKNQKIITLEGLAGVDGKLHPVQEAFIEEQAAQCGYCLNGMIISAVSLLEENKSPDRQTINRHMSGMLCRCGTYTRFLRALANASEKMSR
jgi:nicotinate dehydrogenase subunit A